MTQIINWSEYDCINLIREFRKNPILWDPKDPLFTKKSLKTLLWAEIAQRIGMPADECKHKMVILMSSFRREKAKIMQCIKDEDQDISNCYKSTWFAFHEMAFLLDKEAERKLQAKVVTGSDIEESSLKKRMLERHVQTPFYSDKISRKGSKISARKKIPKKMMRVAAESMNNISENLPGSSAASHEISRIAVGSEVSKQTVDDSPGLSVSASGAVDEEIKAFATFIANKMKKYSETTKNAVQQAICEIIFKADQGHFEKRRDRIVAVTNESDSLDQSLEFDMDEHSIKVEDIVETYSDSDLTIDD